jgi:hypothetical protein
MKKIKTAMKNAEQVIVNASLANAKATVKEIVAASDFTMAEIIAETPKFPAKKTFPKKKAKITSLPKFAKPGFPQITWTGKG